MRLTDFKKRKILVMGLGLHGGGVGAAAFFSRLGSRVVVTDLKTKRGLAPSIAKLKRFKAITYHLGGHRPADFKTADYVIQGPGVPENSQFLRIAKQARVPVLSDVEIFFRACPAPIIGITGTKGKSTAASLLFELLGAKIGRGSRAAPWVRPSRIKRGSSVWLGGNIRKSMLEFLPQVRAGDHVVLELSSFQLDSLKRQKQSPPIAIITNVFPDHLNRYPSMRAYGASKANIFKYQKRGDRLFINAKDPLLRRLARTAPGRVMRFNPDAIARRFRTSIPPDVPSYHIPNIAAAAAVATHLGVGDREIRRAIARFRGLEGRLELVRRFRGVEFVNDTTATNPGAAAAAVGETKRRIGKRGLHVIAGGADKGLPVGELVQALVKQATSVVFLPGTATNKIKANIKRQKSKMRKPASASSMREAVNMAYRNAARGDVVLLSPGAASFGLFKHEFDRGKKFVEAVRRLR
ncbi:MAG: UDP-N-acetylmuramoylalanine--D-glutamate ligase [Candidatus Sungbacteria bacterium RIFCSPLOWO2_01_FULL_59_16]|uniref:UDP-N-acetylmuramoylalanine--D-glutamate ligase n=1 Tax=Candidatus Sungbacteria bacterium RIFCSPLOWO2_01_FULL_59_16 TaxID=1802280 RepID=A0A1G2LDB8_9BACT|nr:MAG: UDP-N-acetylmuramoylalanine--D-glutamate ligase [Candidatus Sungbacteria bacterium RIFCSPLOWO2_01_FULL_59_16]